MRTPLFAATALGLVACRPATLGSGETDSAGVSGDCPKLHLGDTSEIEWRDVPIDDEQFQELEISNECSGSGDLHLTTALSDLGRFDVNTNSALLAPGESLTLVLSYHATDYETHEATLTLSDGTNSADLPLSATTNPDSDADGFDAIEAGGTDCDDTDDSLNPDADEVWYDGVDSDCDGTSDNDADRDGHDADYVGGDDCDDTNADISPGETEVWYDGIDADCDGSDDYDRDGDGFDGRGGGGRDCDDMNASVFPGASDTWYDGVDSNCDGADDYDADGDGSASEAYGGDDCDDGDASIDPAAGETAWDGADDDCDGFVDEDFVVAGSVLITEIMLNPVQVSDAEGEWFELHNTTTHDIDLYLWEIQADDGDSIELSTHTVIDAGDYVVFGTNDDPTANGGVTVHVDYDRATFSLSNAGDSIWLVRGGEILAEVEYTSTWDLVEGASLSLDPSVTDAADASVSASWCAATSAFGSGDLGTPGSENDYCAGFDRDGDGFTEEDGDCDESDASVHPGASEAWDGVDNDCDGVTDRVGSDDATSSVIGDSGDYLGYYKGVSVGDFDGDGQLDLALGATTDGATTTGVVWLLDGTDWESFGGAAASTLADYEVEGLGRYNGAGPMGQVQGDNDGDGIDDLFVGAADGYGYYYGYTGAAGLFYGGSLSGRDDLTDADVLFVGADAYASTTISVYSALDFDGDGTDDLFYGDTTSRTGSTTYYSGSVVGFMASGLSSSSLDLVDDPDFRFTGPGTYAYLGGAMSGGDLDGDGYDDLVATAYSATGGAAYSGVVYVLLGEASPSGTGSIGSASAIQIEGAASYDYLGQTGEPVVADFNDDGAADLALSARGAREVYVFLSAGSLSGSVDADHGDVIIRCTGPAYPGVAMMGGDWTGDGVADLAIAEPDYNSPSYASYYADEPGTVSVFSGPALSRDTDTGAADGLLTGSGVDLFGLGMATGDLSGDGVDEIIIAAPTDGATGSVFLFQTS